MVPADGQSFFYDQGRFLQGQRVALDAVAFVGVFDGEGFFYLVQGGLGQGACRGEAGFQLVYLRPYLMEYCHLSSSSSFLRPILGCIRSLGDAAYQRAGVEVFVDAVGQHHGDEPDDGGYPVFAFGLFVHIMRLIRCSNCFLLPFSVRVAHSPNDVKDETPPGEGQRLENPIQPTRIVQEQTFICEEGLPHQKEEAGEQHHRVIEAESAGTMGLQCLEDAANGGRQEDQALYSGECRVPPRGGVADIVYRGKDGIGSHHCADQKSQYQHPVEADAEVSETECLHIR